MGCVLVLEFFVSQSGFENRHALVFVLVKKSCRLGYFHACNIRSQKE
jgi:hypothetical protein